MGDAIRNLWRFTCLGCCVGTFALCMREDGLGATLVGSAAFLFFWLSERQYPDLDS